MATHSEYPIVPVLDVLLPEFLERPDGRVDLFRGLDPVARVDKEVRFGLGYDGGSGRAGESAFGRGMSAA